MENYVGSVGLPETRNFRLVTRMTPDDVIDFKF